MACFFFFFFAAFIISSSSFPSLSLARRKEGKQVCVPQSRRLPSTTCHPLGVSIYLYGPGVASQLLPTHTSASKTFSGSILLLIFFRLQYDRNVIEEHNTPLIRFGYLWHQRREGIFYQIFFPLLLFLFQFFFYFENEFFLASSFQRAAEPGCGLSVCWSVQGNYSYLCILFQRRPLKLIRLLFSSTRLCCCFLFLHDSTQSHERNHPRDGRKSHQSFLLLLLLLLLLPPCCINFKMG